MDSSRERKSKGGRERRGSEGRRREGRREENEGKASVRERGGGEG